MSEHRFDPITLYCLDCGCSIQDHRTGRECSPKNVLAISHILAKRIFEREMQLADDITVSQSSDIFPK